MRIISVTKLKGFWVENPDAEKALKIWIATTRQAAWKNTAGVKQSFGVRVDFVKVASGATVAVFDVANNKYRMIAAIHYLARHSHKGRVYVLRMMDHREYDQARWKEEL